MILTHNGQKYEIENWEEFKETLLTAIGLQVEDAIVGQINDMRLVDTGNFKNSIKSIVQNGELIITSTAPYAQYLEYGTFAYWNQFGKESFPATMDPKKKNLSRKAAKSLPKGMQPFAPFRRVMWNQNRMSKIIDKGVKVASR
jgi:hypothetical protein